MTTATARRTIHRHNLNAAELDALRELVRDEAATDTDPAPRPGDSIACATQGCAGHADPRWLCCPTCWDRIPLPLRVLASRWYPDWLADNYHRDYLYATACILDALADATELPTRELWADDASPACRAAVRSAFIAADCGMGRIQ